MVLAVGWVNRSGYPAPPALDAKFTTLDAAVDPMMTTSAIDPVPIWMVAPAVYAAGGAADRVQLVVPTARPPVWWTGSPATTRW